MEKLEKDITKSILDKSNTWENSSSLNHLEISKENINDFSELKSEKKSSNKNDIKHKYSIEELTKKFIQYIYKEKPSIINLKNISEKIKIKKRKIDDITNALEGKTLLFNINFIF